MDEESTRVLLALAAYAAGAIAIGLGLAEILGRMLDRRYRAGKE